MQSKPKSSSVKAATPRRRSRYYRRWPDGALVLTPAPISAQHLVALERRLRELERFIAGAKRGPARTALSAEAAALQEVFVQQAVLPGFLDTHA